MLRSSDMFLKIVFLAMLTNV